jgi:DNA repair protein RecN (Recombination protein N)
VTVLLKDAQQQLSRIAGYDPRFAALAERLSSAFYEAEEMGVELRDLTEGESFDPEQNERILSRLDAYKRLEKRYGMEADELADYAERLRDEMNGFASMDDRLHRAEADFKARLNDYRAAAGELTASRRALAKRFEGMMESQLSELGMGSTRFSCAFLEPDPGQKRVPSVHGDDHVEFFIAPTWASRSNPCPKPRPAASCPASCWR